MTIEPKTPAVSAPAAPTIDPASATAPTPPSAAPAPAASTGGLPDDLLQVPALQAVMAGSPAAVSANIKEFASNPVAKLIIQNKDNLLKAGMGFYTSLSGDIGVLFNQFHVHPEDIQAADKAGKLLAIAPSFDEVNQAVAKAGDANPVLAAKQIPGGPASPQPKVPGQMAQQNAGATMPAVVQSATSPGSSQIQKQIMGLRSKNLQVGAPTQGAAPGQGRLLNQILKPVV